MSEGGWKVSGWRVLGLPASGMAALGGAKVGGMAGFWDSGCIYLCRRLRWIFG